MVRPEVSATVIGPIGTGVTVIVVVAVAVQPLTLVTVTVYVVVEAGVTVIAAVIAPVLHTYPVPPEAVNVAEAPVHIWPSLFMVPDVSATAMEGVGSGLTVIVVEEAALQLSALVNVTVKVVVTGGVTTMVCVLAPVLQE